MADESGKSSLHPGRRERVCEGWPHEYDPQNCPVDYEVHKWESARSETKMGERSQERLARHSQAGEV